MVKRDLDSMLIDNPLLYLKINQIRARNRKEATRGKIKKVVYSAVIGFALIYGSIFIHNHPKSIDYIRDVGRVVTDVINSFYR